MTVVKKTYHGVLRWEHIPIFSVNLKFYLFYNVNGLRPEKLSVSDRL